jgi:hypothetical protein
VSVSSPAASDHQAYHHHRSASLLSRISMSQDAIYFALGPSISMTTRCAQPYLQQIPTASSSIRRLHHLILAQHLENSLSSHIFGAALLMSHLRVFKRLTYLTSSLPKPVGRVDRPAEFAPHLLRIGQKCRHHYDAGEAYPSKPARSRHAISSATRSTCYTRPGPLWTVVLHVT